MAILGNKKVMSPQRPNGTVPEPTSRKEGVPFHDLFNLSRVRSPGKSVTSILEKPVSHSARSTAPQATAAGAPSLKSAKSDLGSIRSWVAMEEKIIHGPGAAREIAEEMTSANISRVPSTLPEKKDASSRGFFNFSKPKVSSKNVQNVLGGSDAKKVPSKVRKPDVKSVESWVAMEERIVHDPVCNAKRTAGNQGSKKIKIVGPQVPLAVKGSASKGKPSLGGFFSFFKSRSSRENSPIVASEIKDPSEGALKVLPLDLSKVNVAAVRNWVASEEEAVGMSRGAKSPATKDIGLEFKASQKSLASVPGELMPRATASLPRETLIVKESVHDLEKTSRGLRTFLWVLGWGVAGVFMFFYAREISLTREAEQRSSRVQAEKSGLERSYAALKSVSDDQAAEMIWLRSQLEDMTWELKGTKADIVKLRDTVRTKDEIVQALKAQTEALEKIIAQQTKTPVVSSASEASEEETVRPAASAVRGQITSINDRRGFIVVNMGSSQGVHSGQWVMLTRFDKKLGFGRIDRVYPNMSVALLQDREMFRMIREGDSVFFS